MTYRTRRKLFLVSTFLFLVISVPLLFYTFGYRFSFSDRALRQTGGVFIHSNPAGSRVTIGLTSRTTSFITGNIFIQNLDPGMHEFTVTYNGFQQWGKSLPILPSAVTEAYPILMPTSPQHTALLTGSTTIIHTSPDASILLLDSKHPTQPVQVYDAVAKRFLSFENALSRSLAASIPPDATWQWDNSNTYALIQIPNDWLELWRANNIVRVESLYKQTELSLLVHEQPRFIAQDPNNPATYFVLAGTNFARWERTTKSFKQLLQSIGGFSVLPAHLTLWDTQNGQPYETDLLATNARLWATTSIANISRTTMYESTDSLVLLADNGLWLMPRNGGTPILLEKTYDPQRVLITQSYVLWWDDHTATIYWTLPVNDLPTFQTQRQETIYQTDGNLQRIAIYPGEHYLIVQNSNALFTLELDGRGGMRNKHIIYEGVHPTFHVPPEERIIYILDEGSLFTIDLP